MHFLLSLSCFSCIWKGWTTSFVSYLVSKKKKVKHVNKNILTSNSSVMPNIFSYHSTLLIASTTGYTLPRHHHLYCSTLFVTIIIWVPSTVVIIVAAATIVRHLLSLSLSSNTSILSWHASWPKEPFSFHHSHGCLTKGYCCHFNVIYILSCSYMFHLKYKTWQYYII